MAGTIKIKVRTLFQEIEIVSENGGYSASIAEIVKQAKEVIKELEDRKEFNQ